MHVRVAAMKELGVERGGGNWRRDVECSEGHNGLRVEIKKKNKMLTKK